MEKEHLRKSFVPLKTETYKSSATFKRPGRTLYAKKAGRYSHGKWSITVPYSRNYSGGSVTLKVFDQEVRTVTDVEKGKWVLGQRAMWEGGMQMKPSAIITDPNSHPPSFHAFSHNRMNTLRKVLMPIMQALGLGGLFGEEGAPAAKGAVAGEPIEPQPQPPIAELDDQPPPPTSSARQFGERVMPQGRRGRQGRGGRMNAYAIGGPSGEESLMSGMPADETEMMVVADQSNRLVRGLSNTVLRRARPRPQEYLNSMVAPEESDNATNSGPASRARLAEQPAEIPADMEMALAAPPPLLDDAVEPSARESAGGPTRSRRRRNVRFEPTHSEIPLPPPPAVNNTFIQPIVNVYTSIRNELNLIHNAIYTRGSEQARGAWDNAMDVIMSERVPVEYGQQTNADSFNLADRLNEAADRLASENRRLAQEIRGLGMRVGALQDQLSDTRDELLQRQQSDASMVQGMGAETAAMGRAIEHIPGGAAGLLEGGEDQAALEWQDQKLLTWEEPLQAVNVMLSGLDRSLVLRDAPGAVVPLQEQQVTEISINNPQLVSAFFRDVRATRDLASQAEASVPGVTANIVDATQTAMQTALALARQHSMVAPTSTVEITVLDDEVARMASSVGVELANQIANSSDIMTDPVTRQALVDDIKQAITDTVRQVKRRRGSIDTGSGGGPQKRPKNYHYSRRRK